MLLRQANTTGVNCHQCARGFFRPRGVSRSDPAPCRECRCDTFGSTGHCFADQEEAGDDGEPGDCHCKPGYAGPECTRCQVGFYQYPKCAPCPCSMAGTLNGMDNKKCAVRKYMKLLLSCCGYYWYCMLL